MTTPPNPGRDPARDRGRSRQPDDSPEATFAEVDRLMSLVEEIGRLVDGSSQCVAQARQSLGSDAALAASASISQAGSHLFSAAESLDKMSELVHAAMQGRSMPLGSPLLNRARPVTLGEAVEHAMEVLRPVAQESRVEFRVHVPHALASEPAGALYSVLLNGVQNAIEAVARKLSNAPTAGTVAVLLQSIAPPESLSFGKDSRDWCELRIEDDGVGPPGSVDASRVFDLGFTTKRGGAGVGLAVARNVIKQMGGSIELEARRAAEEAAPGKPRKVIGATLIVRFPVPARSGQLRLGGAA